MTRGSGPIALGAWIVLVEEVEGPKRNQPPRTATNPTNSQAILMNLDTLGVTESSVRVPTASVLES